MGFVLLKTLEGVEYYVDIPDVPIEPDDRFVVYGLSREEINLMMSVVDDLDNACNGLLDLGDVDYFTGEKLVALNKWLEINCNSENQKLNTLLLKLKEFVEQAISLGTGVVITL